MRSSSILLLIALLLLTATLGCATGPYALEARYAGKMDPAANQKVVDAATELPWDGVYAVDVYMDTLPPGVILDDEKAIKVAPDAESRISVIGFARSYQQRTRWVTQMRAAFFYENMHPRHSGTRDTYCKVQTPFRMVTLSLWSVVPFQWPCFFDYSTDALDNTAIHVQELKRLAHAMGGNMVVISGVSGRIETWGSLYATATHKSDAVEMRALVFLDRSKGAPSAAPATPAAPAPSPSPTPTPTP